MDYFRNIVVVAAIAGVLAGLGMTVAQQLTTVPLILKAEVYEGAGHSEPRMTTAMPPRNLRRMSMAMRAGSPPTASSARPSRLLANIVTGVGFALLLVAASELAGGITGWRQGVFWGLAGFAVFTLAPSLGLPPELPAMPAAELGARQLWWVATALSAAAALALMFYGRTPFAIVAAVALLVAPHLVGAPEPPSYDTPIPEGLHHSFVVAVVLTALLFWVLLGALAGLFRERFIHASG